MILEIIIGIVGAVVVLLFLPFLIPIAVVILFVGGLLLAIGLVIEGGKFANIIVIILLAIPAIILAAFLFAIGSFLRDENARNHNLRLTVLRLLLKITPTIGTHAQLKKIAKIKSIDEVQESLEISAAERANQLHDGVCASLESEINKVLDTNFGNCLLVDSEISTPIPHETFRWSIPKRTSSFKIFIENKQLTKMGVCEITVTTEPYSSNQSEHYYKILSQHRILFETESDRKLLKWVKKAVVKFAKANPEFATQLVKN